MSVLPTADGHAVPQTADDFDDVLAGLGAGEAPPPVVDFVAPCAITITDPEPVPIPLTVAETPPPVPEPVITTVEFPPPVGRQAPPPQPPRVDAATIRSIVDAPPEELTVDPRTGRVRQAGATDAEGQWTTNYRLLAERELFVFAKGIMGAHWLTRTLHLPVCRYLTTERATLEAQGLRALGLLFPRDHGKSSIVSQSMPPHMFVQPADANIYFPGLDGRDTAIILCCRTEAKAAEHGSVARRALESNKLLRAFWPHLVWHTKTGRGETDWNNTLFRLPTIGGRRSRADPSFKAVGVDGSITGAHPHGLIKDDLVDEHEAQSPLQMETAWTWHGASRALINRAECREWVIGTRWAIGDIYDRMIRDDTTVHFWRRAIVEDGACIWPERFSLEREPGKVSVDELRAKHGVLFPLLYMNSAADPSLTDFDMTEIRDLRIVGDTFEFDDLPADAILRARVEVVAAPPTAGRSNDVRGQRLTSDVYDRLEARYEHLRLRAA